MAESIAEIVAIEPQHRSPAQARKLLSHYLQNLAPEVIRRIDRRVWSLHQQRKTLVKSLPTVMVMQEMESRRDTFVLKRGQYDQPGERVEPGVLSIVGTLPSGVANDRLGFAKWLVDDSNPLTARVTVNRYWQMLFGKGLVRTAEDFGTQGEPPSHPQLLDWLAVEFIDGQWSTKALLKTIVMSATYRQSSRISPTLQQRDPENRLLARSPRVRLSAAMLRDQALAVGGLLTEEVGGPSVRPYQPAGLWKEIATDTNYEQSHGRDLYRRSVYTYWKRTVAPPNMIVLDASSREACAVRVTRTNTPLQALALMNDVTFVEAARALAQRVMTSRESSEHRLQLAFRLATARKPQPTELRLLLAALTQHTDDYANDEPAALKLISTGESPRDEQLDTVQLAAYTAVCSLILNLDESMTRE